MGHKASQSGTGAMGAGRPKIGREDDGDIFDGTGDYKPVNPKVDVAMRISGLLYKAQQSTYAAEDELSAFNNLMVTKETLRAAQEAANAWTALWQEMNRRAPVEDGSASKPQPSIAAPSPEPIPAVDPWEGLDIPPSLRRAPKEVAA